jgi:cobalt-zinc-cadmium efflux system outer membrane protein
VIISTLAIPAGSAISQANAASAPALTLRALLASVRVDHPLVQAANSQVRAAVASRSTARTLPNPVFSVQTDQTPSFAGGNAAGMERETMAMATLPLEFLYQRSPRVARANAEVRAAEADAMATRQRIALDASAAFYRTALAQVQVTTTLDLLRWLDTLVAYNRARVEEGVTAEVDLIRSELERDRLAAESSMQEAELAQARAALAAFVSEPRATVSPSVTVEESPFRLPNDTGAAAPSAQASAAAGPDPAIDARPDVRAARERLTASGAAIAGERSMFLRELGATIGTMRVGQMSSMIAGVSFPLPLFDQNRGEVRRAQAEREVAAFELLAQERTAGAELAGAFESARTLTAQAERLARRDSLGFLARAEESRRIALGAYREGAVPLYQVIDAARSWAEARMTYYQTLFAQHQSVLMLAFAQGRDVFAFVAGGSR